MIAFRLLFAIDAVIALVVLYFFVDGIGDGTVSSFNMGIWLLLLGAVALPLIGGWIVKERGNRMGANAILAVMAIPGCLIGLFFLLLIALPGSYR